MTACGYIVSSAVYRTLSPLLYHMGFPAAWMHSLYWQCWTVLVGEMGVLVGEVAGERLYRRR